MILFEIASYKGSWSNLRWRYSYITWCPTPYN